MKKYNLRELQDKLDRCKNIPLDEINPDDVDELSEVKISRKKSKEERILDFIFNVKNPYVFKVDDKLVKIGFTDNGKSAEECLMNVIDSLYR